MKFKVNAQTADREFFNKLLPLSIVMDHKSHSTGHSIYRKVVWRPPGHCPRQRTIKFYNPTLLIFWILEEAHFQ